MNPLVIIPARGGSKGVPGKNIKMLGNKPLIEYTIEVARNVFSDKFICVSTDDIKIKEIVESMGLLVPFIRPAELALDNSGTYEVLLHACQYYESKGYKPDTIILLQPTSPFRTTKHLIEALKLFDKECDMVVSVMKTKSNPYYNLREENKKGWLDKSKKGDYTRRQDCPIVYEVNGAIYVMHYKTLKAKPMHQFKKMRKYIMEEFASIDIDSILDFEFAEFLIKKQS